jgi:divalent metal cation (Fe/Co/Zn/Cd) transporter
LCRFQKWSPSITALATDHRNDVISNTLLLSAVLISKFLYPQYTWVLDPFAALCASIFIIKNWVEQGYEHVRKLMGMSPSSYFHQRLTRIVYHHSESILFIDTVRAFHVGEGIWCEIDIGLDPETPLQVAHDIGESLQKKIELIEGIK